MNLNELMKKATKKNKNTKKHLRVVETAIEEKQNHDKSKKQKWNDCKQELVEKLQEYNGIRISGLVWTSDYNSGYRIYDRSCGLKIELNERYKTIDLTSDISISVEKENCFDIYQNFFPYKTHAKYLDLTKGHTWKTKNNAITLELHSIEEVIQYTQDLIMEFLDVESEENRKNQTKKRKILAEYLDLETITDSDLERFDILEKSEVNSYFKNIISNDILKYFDIELAAKYSYLSLNEIQSIKKSIESEKSLQKLLNTIITVDNYSQELSDLYSFDKFVIPFKKHYIVDKKRSMK